MQTIAETDVHRWQSKHILLVCSIIWLLFSLISIGTQQDILGVRAKRVGTVNGLQMHLNQFRLFLISGLPWLILANKLSFVWFVDDVALREYLAEVQVQHHMAAVNAKKRGSGRPTSGPPPTTPSDLDSAISLSNECKYTSIEIPGRVHGELIECKEE